MADAFYGEIRAFPFTFAPMGWALCDGHLLPIAQNQALFSLLGNFFGGDGKSTFAVPNLQGLVITNSGQALTGTNYPFGVVMGKSSVQLSPLNMPQHNHNLCARVSSGGVAGMTPVAAAGVSMLSRTLTTANKSFNAFDKPPITSGQETTVGLGISNYGGNPEGAAVAHNNMMPYLTLRYFICTDGQYPIPAA